MLWFSFLIFVVDTYCLVMMWDTYQVFGVKGCAQIPCARSA